MQIDKTSSDNRVGFNNDSHLYFDIETGEKLTSCTTFLKKYYPAFNEEKKAAKVAQRENKTIEDIKLGWSANRIKAAEDGTYIHAILEHLVLYGYPLSVERYHPKLNAALKFYDDYFTSGKWELLSAEELLYSSTLGISGQRDLKVRETKTGKIISADYKTSKTIRDLGFYDEETQDTEKMLAPFESLENCELVKYSLQLQIYNYLDPIKSDELVIVHLTEDGYDIIPALDIQIDFNQNNEIVYVNKPRKNKFFLL